MNTPTHPRLAALTDEDFVRQARRAVHALPDVPPTLENAALALFQGQAQAVPAAAAATAALVALGKGVAAHILAVLTFDSWSTSAVAAGMRSVRSPTRHLLFSAQGRDVDLRIAPQTPAAQAYALSGQILGPDTGGEVELLADAAGDAGQVRRVSLDDLGEFRIEDLPRGLYRMTLQLGDRQIELPPVEVGAAAGESAGDPHR